VTYKRAALFLFGGSLLLLTPFLINLSQGVEKSIFSAMATLTDVKETLDDRLIKMSDLYLSLDSTPVEKQSKKIKEARQHYVYAKDVHKLATSFIAASSKRYPRYSTFWERYTTRLESTWIEIQTVEGKLVALASAQKDGIEVVNAGKSKIKKKTPSVVAAKALSVAARKTPTAQGTKSPSTSEQKQSSILTKNEMISPTRSVAVKNDISKSERSRNTVSSTTKTASKTTKRKTTVRKTTLKKKDVLMKYREGYQYYAQGGTEKLNKAVAAFADILNTQPSFHLARYWLAKTHLLLGEVARADKEAVRLLKAQPNLQIAKDLSKEVKTVIRLKGIKSTKPLKSSVLAPVKIVKNPAAQTTSKTHKKSELDAATKAMLARINRRVGGAEQIKTYNSYGGYNTGKVDPGSHAKKSATSQTNKSVAPSSVQPVIAARPMPVTATPARPIMATPPSAQATYQYNKQKSNHRPIACMVENSKRARPQSGLSEADIVYEMPVEGGITRFMAIFLDPKNTTVAKLGPVRSARHYFVQQIPAYDALYAHCGASTMGYAELKKLNVDDIDEIRYGHGFFRDKKRSAPHNLYTSMKGLTKAFSRKGFATEKRRKHTFMPVLSNATVGQNNEYIDLDLKYHRKYSVGYTYSPVSKTYGRKMNGENHCEAGTTNQIQANNVVVVSVKTRVIDKYGRLDMDLVTGGDAVLHRSGEVISGKWKRDSIYGGILFLDKKGRRCALNPGKTWVQFINQRASMTVARRPVSNGDRMLARRIASAKNAAAVQIVAKPAYNSIPNKVANMNVYKPVVSAVGKSVAPKPVVPKPVTISRAYPANPVRVAPTPEMYPEPTRETIQSASAAHPVAMTGEIDVIDFELDAF